ncbi:MAG: hypothetical protein AABX35_00140 [Nanoarchaeota archaeon]
MSVPIMARTIPFFLFFFISINASIPKIIEKIAREISKILIILDILYSTIGERNNNIIDKMPSVKLIIENKENLFFMLLAN